MFNEIGHSASAEKEVALEYLTLVLHHPSCHQGTKDRIASHYDALLMTLSPEAVTTAQARGRSLDLLTASTETNLFSAPRKIYDYSHRYSSRFGRIPQNYRHRTHSNATAGFRSYPGR